MSDDGVLYLETFDEQFRLVVENVARRLEQFGCTPTDISTRPSFLHPSLDIDSGLLAERAIREAFGETMPALSLATTSALDKALVRLKVIAYKPS